MKFMAIPIPGVSFVDWQTFDEPIAAALIPDGYAELRTPREVLASFIEVDLGTERTSVWDQKVRNYLAFAVSGQYRERFGPDRFRVLVVASSDRRMDSLRKATASVTEKIFWFANLDSVKRMGMFASIWLRPKDDKSQTLVTNN
jgi:hypothetical protein